MFDPEDGSLVAPEDQTNMTNIGEVNGIYTRFY